MMHRPCDRRLAPRKPWRLLRVSAAPHSVEAISQAGRRGSGRSTVGTSQPSREHTLKNVLPDTAHLTSRDGAGAGLIYYTSVPPIDVNYYFSPAPRSPNFPLSTSPLLPTRPGEILSLPCPGPGARSAPPAPPDNANGSSPATIIFTVLFLVPKAPYRGPYSGLGLSVFFLFLASSAR